MQIGIPVDRAFSMSKFADVKYFPRPQPWSESVLVLVQIFSSVLMLVFIANIVKYV